MYTKFLIWLLNLAFNSKMRKNLEPCIKKLYREMANESLYLTTEIVKVKKGKLKYTLVYFETKDGKLKCNIGRHVEKYSPSLMFYDIY